jgi:integrin alpha 8
MFHIGNVKIFDYFISAAPLDVYRVQNKNGQQMGGTIYSSDGVFVACAPLWTYVGTANIITHYRGLCVYSGRELKDFIRLYPCDRSSISDRYCEAGFSVTSSFTNSTTSNNAMVNQIVLLTGAPTGLTFSGGAFFYSNIGKNFTELQEMNLIDGSGITQQPNIRISPDTVDFNSKYTYYGYAMTSGFLTRRTIKDFIITAPRHTQYTQVGRKYR